MWKCEVTVRNYSLLALKSLLWLGHFFFLPDVEIPDDGSSITKSILAPKYWEAINLNKKMLTAAHKKPNFTNLNKQHWCFLVRVARIHKLSQSKDMLRKNREQWSTLHDYKLSVQYCPFLLHRIVQINVQMCQWEVFTLWISWHAGLQDPLFPFVHYYLTAATFYLVLNPLKCFHPRQTCKSLGKS